MKKGGILLHEEEDTAAGQDASAPMPKIAQKGRGGFQRRWSSSERVVVGGSKHAQRRLAGLRATGSHSPIGNAQRLAMGMAW